MWPRLCLLTKENLFSGVSNEALKFADKTVIIPQAPGFVDSFNVSVAAAITLYEARTSRARVLGQHADLKEGQHNVLLAAMLLRHKVGSMPLVRQSLTINCSESLTLIWIIRQGLDSLVLSRCALLKA